MANDEFREQQQASREVGLKARHETRVERAREREAEFVQATLWKVANTARREVAEEIAQAIEAAWIERQCSILATVAAAECASIAREIGAKETP